MNTELATQKPQGHNPLFKAGARPDMTKVIKSAEPFISGHNFPAGAIIEGKILEVYVDKTSAKYKNRKLIKIQTDDGMICSLPYWSKIEKLVGAESAEWQKNYGKRLWMQKTGETFDEETGRTYQDLEIHLLKE
jgi:hypothetical protein